MKAKTKGVCFRIPVRQIEHLKAVARKMSFSEGRTVLYTDLMRDAAAARYPTPDAYTIVNVLSFDELDIE